MIRLALLVLLLLSTVADKKIYVPLETLEGNDVAISSLNWNGCHGEKSSSLKV
jgi:hypothetical protein